jgi:hypothetical protein
LTAGLHYSGVPRVEVQGAFRRHPADHCRHWV